MKTVYCAATAAVCGLVLLANRRIAAQVLGDAGFQQESTASTPPDHPEFDFSAMVLLEGAEAPSDHRAGDDEQTGAKGDAHSEVQDVNSSSILPEQTPPEPTLTPVTLAALQQQQQVAGLSTPAPPPEDARLPSWDELPHAADLDAILQQNGWSDASRSSSSLEPTVLFTEEPADSIPVQDSQAPPIGLAAPVLPSDEDDDGNSASAAPVIFVTEQPADMFVPPPISTDTYTVADYFADVAARAASSAEASRAALSATSSSSSNK